MKVLLSIAATGFLGLYASAQQPEDALRSSWNVQGGTARVQAVGGAMGSLGGDITATFVNPAGLGFFKTGDFVFSPQFQGRSTKGTYLGRKESRSSNRFTWGTSGVVLGGTNESSKGGAALSIAYNRMADFNSNFEYRGFNTTSSYSQKYLEEIRRNNVHDGNTLDQNFEFGPSLAFRTYYIDTIGGSTNGNFQFQSRAANIVHSSGLLQQNSVQTKGGIDELAIGVGTQATRKWMFGGTIGIPIMHYKRSGEFVEADATSNPSNKFNYAMITEELHTTGIGFNLKLGAIYKPSEFWRLGLAVHSPSIYSLTDKYETAITADVESASSGPLVSDSKEFNDGKPTESKYDYISPYKVIGSISYVLREIQDVRKQRGFLTADVEYINYKASSYLVDDEQDPNGTTKAYYKEVNKAINRAYQGAFNFRAGGELKFTTVMVRAGIAYYGNPYKNLQGEKGSRLNLSGGLGYRNKGFFVDLTYIYALNKDVNFAYRLAQAPYYDAQLRTTAGTGVITVGFKI